MVVGVLTAWGISLSFDVLFIVNTQDNNHTHIKFNQTKSNAMQYGFVSLY